jgi:hypothetical protein
MAISVRRSLDDIVKRLREFLDGIEENLDKSLETASANKGRIDAEEKRGDYVQPRADE